MDQDGGPESDRRPTAESDPSVTPRPSHQAQPREQFGRRAVLGGFRPHDSAQPRRLIRPFREEVPRLTGVDGAVVQQGLAVVRASVAGGR